MTALKEFLQLFKIRKEEIQVELFRLEEAFSYEHEHLVKQKQRLEYLLQVVNMFLFHSHILLRKCDE